MPWQKGQSGNPQGRPKSPLAFSEVLRKRLTQRAKRSISDKAISMAEGGDIKAMVFLRDTADGRPVQRQEISGPAGGPIDIRHVRDQLATRLDALAERRGEKDAPRKPQR